MLTGQLTDRLTAFKRLQRNPKLEGRRVSPPSLDHRAAPPQAWCIASLYTLDRGPVFGAHFIPLKCFFHANLASAFEF